MTYETILVETRGKVGLITLNRPEALNALNAHLMGELIQALQAFDTDPQIGAMVIAGSERAFAAGGDIKEMRDKTLDQMMSASLLDGWQALRKIRKAIIAAVSGWALGGGCELAMNCDLIIASETAKFGQPELNVGIIPGAGGTQRLTHAVGKVLAMEIVLADRKLSAEEALQFGLINHVVPVDNFVDKALEVAQTISERAPLAAQLGKEAINQAYELSLSEGLRLERHLFNLLFTTEDQTEGMTAFIEKRKPQWKGR